MIGRRLATQFIVKSQFSDIFPNWNILFLFFCVKTCPGYLNQTAFTVYPIGVAMFSVILSMQAIRGGNGNRETSFVEYIGN
jgi:hypothetical protein